MSITEVKINRISAEEKYYRQKANKYLAEHTPVTVKYKWKRTIQNIFYPDMAASRFPSQGRPGEMVRSFINPIEYNSEEDAFASARKQAEVDKEQHRSSVSLSIQNGKIIFQVYMGSEQPQRGRAYGPNEPVPSTREEFWRYTYEIIS